ncbi:pirin family protein [Terrimonas ferruginea]|uniref:pirin family protein n=1 Tax=Terrimonas ferruginea TaxID=249 RepID=UPI000407CF22|nr:pirin family protein [Terrimonas ferruginea]
MAIKTVQQVLAPPDPHMVGDGFRVHNFFPGGYNMGKKRMSPFFLLDYNSLVDFAARETPRGVGVHPHRGFETVTIAYQGKVAHHDSAGHSGVIGEGDVQWMTAGSGILHKEYHDAEYSRTGGPFQMVQLWVNLPQKDKMTTPKYQEITRGRMGQYHLPGDQGTVEVIAGSYEGVKGPAHTFTPMEAYNLRVKKGAVVNLDLPAHYNTGLLVVQGGIRINNTEKASLDHFALFENNGSSFTVEALEDSVILVLSGEPIDEPLFAYGPFLMNTYEEVQQAYDDFNKGKFGYLE